MPNVEQDKRVDATGDHAFDLEFTLNGEQVRCRTIHSTLLADLIRDEFGLTGTKVSCEEQICGSCTVLVDSNPVSSCTFLAHDVGGRSVQTVEGLAAGDQALHPLQRAFIDQFAFQCGFCTPGMLMSAASLLQSNPTATRDETIHFMEGNLCRCTGYASILQAIEQAQAELLGVGGSSE